MMANRSSASPSASSTVSASSEELDEDLRRAHNRLSLRLEKDLIPEQLRELKQYFYKAPLDAKICGNIGSFIDLWNALDSYRTIKPGRYTTLKSALDTIGAQACLSTIKKFETREFKSTRDRTRLSLTTPGRSAGVGDLEHQRQEAERERLLKQNAERLRDLAIHDREVSHVRHTGQIQEVWKEIEQQKEELSKLKESGHWRDGKRLPVEQSILKEVGIQTRPISRDGVEIADGLQRDAKGHGVSELSYGQESHSLDEQRRREEAEKVRDLTIKERELSHLKHEKDTQEANDSIETEREQRTRAEKKLDILLQMVAEGRIGDASGVQLGLGRKGSDLTSMRSEEDKDSGVDVLEAAAMEKDLDAGKYFARKIKSRSMSESDTGCAWKVGRQGKFVTTSWDETNSRRRRRDSEHEAKREGNAGDDWLVVETEPRIPRKNNGRAQWRLEDESEGHQSLELSLGPERRELYNVKSTERSCADGEDDSSFVSEDIPLQTRKSCHENRNDRRDVESESDTSSTSEDLTVESTKGTSKRSDLDPDHDLDLDSIFKRVLNFLDMRDLSAVRKTLNNSDFKTRQCVMSLKSSHQTLLFKACVMGQIDFVEYFLSECGAPTEDIGLYVSEGGLCYAATPLWWASYSNQPKMVQTLVAHGAHVNAELTAINSTAVLSACSMGNVDIVKYLAANGADLLKPNANGETCLHKSINKLDLCLFLLNHGVDVNQVDGFGRTPLHHAVESGSIDVVRLLARRGADLRVRDRNGQNALEIARRGGRDKIEALILKIMELCRMSGK